MKRIAHFAAVAAALAFAQPAAAEWGPTRYGMDVQEVIAAVGGNMERTPDRSGRRVHEHQELVVGTIVESGIEYEINFYFGRNGRALSMVRLQPSDLADCGAMRAAYTSRWGAGEDQGSQIGGEGGFAVINIDLIHWPTGSGDEVIELTALTLSKDEPTHCQILYQQRDFVDNSRRR